MKNHLLLAIAVLFLFSCGKNSKTVLVKNIDELNTAINEATAGTEIVLASDIRIAAEHAEFALPEPKVGVVPGAGSMVRLTRA